MNEDVSAGSALPAWPYPRWVAHRGAGTLAPENTIAAFRLGATYGYRMFECDAKLSADGVVFLLHDTSLDRTTNAHEFPEFVRSGIAGEHPWQTLSRLDAGSWHSCMYAGEPLPTLESVARYCIHNDFFLNIEIKPTPGTERETGEAVSREAARLWANQTVPPLLTSFDPDALKGAMISAPELPRGLLLETMWSGWLECAQELNCHAVICDHPLWDEATLRQARQAGFRTLSYTVNDEDVAKKLIALGVDGIITDRIDKFIHDPLSTT